MKTKIKDAADWVAAGGTKLELEKLVLACSPWVPLNNNNTPFPEIITSGRFLRDISDDVWQALLAANNPPSLFQRGRQFVDIIFNDKQPPTLRSLDKAGLKGIVDRIADFVSFDKDDKLKPARPPSDVLDDLMTARDLQLPVIQGITDVPIFDPSGLLCATPGYQPQTGFYLHSPNNLVIPAVPVVPDESALVKARSLLFDELLVDFSFVGDADKANAIAILLLPFIRLMIDGTTPLHMIESPTPGTGKGLLTDVLSIPANGNGPATMTEGRDEDEWRKRITSKLMTAPRVVLIDNVKSKLDSAALSAALTAECWEDRILGSSRTVIVPVKCVWLATANNPTLSLEVARRVVTVQMDSEIEKPWQRNGFKHKYLRRWARNNRGELIWAALTLIQNWIVAGRPLGCETLGSYESWAETMGGILSSAGIRGFLTNPDHAYTEADEEIGTWGEFCSAWWEEFKDTETGADLLFGLCTRKMLLVDVWKGRTDHSAITKFGIALAKRRDRVFGKFIIRKTELDGHSKAQQYRLHLKQSAGGAEACGGFSSPVSEFENNPASESTVAGNCEVNNSELYDQTRTGHSKAPQPSAAPAAASVGDYEVF